MNYYVGIDIGTSSAKLLLINSQGNIIKRSEERSCRERVLIQV